MRIAVLFYGRVNHYEKKFLVNSLPHLCECDFFYSADAEPIDDFIKLYNPVAVVNDKITYNVDFGIYPNNKTNPANIHNMTCHFINKKRVFELLEAHDRVYDLIIATRFDLKLGKLDLSIPEPNTIYIPKGEDHTGLNDRFAMGDFETMRKYMKIYDDCFYYLENGLSVPHPENLTLANVINHKINIVRFPLNHTIMR